MQKIPDPCLYNIQKIPGHQSTYGGSLHQSYDKHVNPNIANASISHCRNLPTTLFPSEFNLHNAPNPQINHTIPDVSFNNGQQNSTNQAPPEGSLHSKGNPGILDLLRMRCRTNITTEKTAILEGAFNVSPFPTSQVKLQLAQMTGLPEKVIAVWFQNRRQRIRRESSAGERSVQSGNSSQN